MESWCSLAHRVPRAATPRAVLLILLATALSLPAVGFAEPQATEAVEPTRDAPAPASTEQSTDAPTHWTFRWNERPTLAFGSKTEIEFRARMQAHLRESEAAMGSTDAFDLTRRRIGIDGRIRGLVDFQIEAEIEDEEPWRDVYVNYRRYDLVQVQAGKFKLPFSLDENTSSTNLDFVYRSRSATQLAPGRDSGVMAHGRGLARKITYQFGVFTHDGRNARTANPELVYGSSTVAGRLVVQPLRSTKSRFQDLQSGIALTTSDVPAGIAALRGRTALDESFFPAQLWVQGARRRLGLELRWRPGPASVKAEYIRLTTERRGQSVDDTDLSPLVASGWYISGSYLLTGERKSAGADSPKRPLFHGGYGAIEAAARIENLRFGSMAVAGGEEPSTSPRADAVLGNADRVATFGVNWYPIRRVKLQLNLIRETIEDPNRGPLPEKPAFWSRVIRFQVSI